MHDETDLLAYADLAVKKALAKGADHVEAWAEQATEISVTLERNDVNSGSSSQYSGMGLRVIRNRSLGFASLNTLTPQLIEEAVYDALAITRYTPPLEHNYLPEKRSLTPAEIYDHDSKSFDVADALSMSSELLNIARSYDSRVLIDFGSFSATIGSQAICTSEGIQAEEKASVFIWQLLGMAREGNEVGSYAAAFDATTRVKDVSVEETATDFSKKAIHALGAKKIESFTGSLILTPLVASSILVGPLIFSSLADNLQKGRSRFSGQLTKQVVDESISLIDDGTIPRAIGSSTFDREGIPHTPLKIIDAGNFIEPLYNSLAANREHKQTSGHAAGSYRSVPAIGPTNLIFAATGERVQKTDQIIANTKKGVLITRFSGDVDPVSGYFSGFVKGGYYIANGEIRHPITSVAIQQNLFESLNRIGSISHETKRIGSWILPEMIELEQIDFTARTEKTYANTSD
ncbi:MAG: TldD/PmbA family protein [Candidatus Hodarchaeales archaeon]|jgi:PmbA protein